jgi:aspartate/methionine/tyrosine aminotransferase
MMALSNPLVHTEPSGIIEVATAALQHAEPVRMWFGESDLATPSCVSDAAMEALHAGQTFYAPRRGLPVLRQAIATYLEGLYGVPVDPERITVTSSGMNAIMVALQAVLKGGGNVVVVSPIWPNISNAITALGAECRHVRLDQDSRAWHLDLERLFAACDASTCAIFVASPGNPTGWVCPPNAQRALLAFCHARGIYLIADEVYQRLVSEGELAPSFLSVADPQSPLMIVNSFSKTWAMTGWRLGWLLHPVGASHCIGELNAVNNTGAATFVQLAGVAAITQGEPFVAHLQQYCRRGRALVHRQLGGIEQVRLVPPAGAMYAFFALDGVDDSLEFARKLATRTGVGLAPGSAFGPGNAGWFRLCYALDEAVLSRALSHLQQFIADWYSG